MQILHVLRTKAGRICFLALSIVTFWEHKEWKSRNCDFLFLKHAVVKGNCISANVSLNSIKVGRQMHCTTLRGVTYI